MDKFEIFATGFSVALVVMAYVVAERGVRRAKRRDAERARRYLRGVPSPRREPDGATPRRPSLAARR